MTSAETPLELASITPQSIRQLLPLSPLDGDLTNADLAVLLESGADPHHLARLGKARLTRLIRQASRGHRGLGGRSSG